MLLITFFRNELVGYEKREELEEVMPVVGKNFEVVD